MPLGGADEQKPAAEGTVEAWGRSPDNPVGGWYGLKKGLRGRFAVYVPPVLEVARPRRDRPHAARHEDAGALTIRVGGCAGASALSGAIFGVFADFLRRRRCR